ncbi:alpha-L-rhamnosidase C-terminal domain-containing protein [Runella sp.]|uniref:alpha-L-rhamnosidase-related protein n=1 Tax=Runella sp. TaxID=1960881 RepID=UPI003D0A90BA
MNRIFCVFLFVLLTVSARSQTIPAPNQLRCDLLLHTGKVSKGGFAVKEPLTSAIQQKSSYQFPLIFNKKPTFNWVLSPAIKNASAFRILVASAPEYLNENKADFWDSKKIKNSHSQAVYNGKPLETGHIYYWKVQVWNDKNEITPFSETASFYLNAPDPTEVFAHYPLAAEMQHPAQLIKKEPDTYFLDFEKDALAQLQLHLTSPVNDSIWIEVGEAIEKPGTIHKNPGRNIRYLKVALFVRKGTYDYSIKWPTNEKRNSRNPVLMPSYIGEVYPFRYVSIQNFKGEIKKESVQRKIVYYPFDENASSFTSSDTVLNQVWDLCKYSIKATSFTGYYIDGDRERIPYEADALINQLSHYAVDAEYSMARRSMTYLLFHPTWPTEWSLQNVLIAWYDYLYTGDDLLLKMYYPELQKKILMPLAGENGLISTRTNKQTDDFLASIHINKLFDGRRGLHDNVDWPQTGDYIGPEKEYKGETDGFVYTNYNAVVNAYYYQNLVLMQKIAALLHKPVDVKLYEAKAQQVYTSFQTVFRDAITGLIHDGDSTNHTSLHANMFALAFGLIPEKDVEKVCEFIKQRRMACSVYGAQFLLDALYDANQGDYALELLTATTQRSWYNMIRVGSTISMEAWDKVYKPNLDLNHAWGAVPANTIVRKLMGIEPLSPAFETFQIKPQLGHLTYADLKTTTIKGTVAVSFKKNANTDTMEVSIPGSTTATVYVPCAANKSNLYINGRKASILPQKGYFLLKDVVSGKHVFVLK